MGCIVERRTHAGHVCEIEVYRVAGGSQKAAMDKEPRLRFASEEERERHKRGIAERRLTRILNANFTPGGYYLTLTFDREHECMTAEDARWARGRYVRTLRRLFPEMIYVFCEGQGGHTARFHLHCAIELPRRDEDDDTAHAERQAAFFEALSASWDQGSVSECESLWDTWIEKGTGSDNGRNYKMLAEYLIGHWRSEYGGKRYSASRNLRKADREAAEELEADTYTQYDPPAAPKAPEGYVYSLYEVQITTYGYKCFTFVLRKLPEVKEGRRSVFKPTVVHYRLGWERARER